MAVRNLSFKAETQKVLHLLTHSLYSNKDIFLRELISNASDAIDRARFESLTKPEIAENNTDWQIKIIPDKDKNTLTISDNGIGMNENEVIENIGTLAKSGTQAILELSKKEELKDHPDMIGQFGVGFYSAFMVADKITLITRTAGNKDAGVKWECTGEEDFTIESVTKETRGTDITLHLNEEAKDYLEEHKIRSIVSKYSDYIEFPITMDIERNEYPKDKDGNPDYKAESTKKIEEETLNSKKAIWLRDKKEITDEEYEEFYKHLTNDFEKPLVHLHYKVEGATEFTALIYIPSARPLNMFTRDHIKNNIHLYVKKVFIMKDSEALLPEYLRFVSGVVDSGDLPLNVSRETLQEHRILKTINKNVMKKVFAALKDLKEKEYDKYKSFYKQFGIALKEGVYSDHENKDTLLSLLLFHSTKTKENEYRSLDDYIKNAPDDQKEIYYIPGENVQVVEQAAHLEILNEKNIEVLYFVEPIDEIMIQSVFEFKDKKFKSILQGDLDLEKDESKSKEKSEKLKSLTEFIKETLKEHVKEVRVSDRLVNSACCLVGDEQDMSVHMEKLMKAYNKDVPNAKRILEINPNHKIIKKIHTLFEKDKNDSSLIDHAEMLYDQALITEGSKLSNPAKFNQRLYDLMLKD